MFFPEKGELRSKTNVENPDNKQPAVLRVFVKNFS
jgi:hypothetical protein